MRTTRPLILCFVLGCGGGTGTDTGTSPPACSPTPTTPLGQVEVTAWPEGLADRIPLYDQLAGRWRTTQCGDDDDRVELKIVVPEQDAIGVVTTPVTADPSCGCPSDPHFAPDATYEVLAITSGIEMLITDFPDLAAQNHNAELQLVMFGPSEPLQLRACGSWGVDPDIDTEWTNAYAMFRMDPSGTLSGTVVLENATTSEVCDLEAWEALPDA